MPANRQATPSEVTTTRAEDSRDTSLGIDARMMLVMERITHIEKGGVGPQSMGSFPFAEAPAVKHAIRTELVRVGVMVHTSFDGHDVRLITGKEGRQWVLATVWGTLAFVNVDDPQQVVRSEIRGQGIDQSDKAIAKAMTSADKYGLLNAFQIPTGDDPDASSEAPEYQTNGAGPPQRPYDQQQYERQHDQALARPAHAAQPWGDGTPLPPAPGQAPPPAQQAPVAQQGGQWKCPVHNRSKSGTYGLYCTAKESDPGWSNDKGYCTRTPGDAYAAANER